MTPLFLLAIYPREKDIYVYQMTYMRMFIAALF